ncbi:MAG: hypothetical protein HOW73_28990, partial [Polyangiaceae bacterium]|nr:hypothetical protein [Polyangiaceae bacterium]
MQPTFSLATLPLVLSPLALVAGASVAAGYARYASSVRPAVLRGIAVASAAAGAVPLALAAADAARGGTVLSHVVGLFRVGSLDATLGFALDRAGLLIALVTLVLVAGVAFAVSGEHKRASAPSVGATLVAGAGALVAALAEGFPTLFFGLGIAYAAGVMYAGTSGADAPRRARFAVGAFGGSIIAASAAVALVFWALGGRWLDGSKYLSDYKERFVLVAQGEAPKADPLATPNARGTLTVVSHPGARVYLGIADESHLARSEPFAETPVVRKELAAGLHKVAIAPGAGAMIASDGLEVALVDAVSIRPGAETTIVLAGPSLTFHEIAPQLGPKNDLGIRRLGPIDVATAATAFWALALLLLALSFGGTLPNFGAARRSGPAAVATACAMIAAGVLVARLGSVVPLSGVAAAAGGLALGVVAVLSARRGDIAAPAAAMVC